MVSLYTSLYFSSSSSSLSLSFSFFFFSLSFSHSSSLSDFYVIFLTILLVDRSFRDDDRCGKKYGASWVEYSGRVPYKIVPGII